MIVPAEHADAVNLPAVVPPIKLEAEQEPVVPIGTDPLEMIVPKDIAPEAFSACVKIPASASDGDTPKVNELSA